MLIDGQVPAQMRTAAEMNALGVRLSPLDMDEVSAVVIEDLITMAMARQAEVASSARRATAARRRS